MTTPNSAARTASAQVKLLGRNGKTGTVPYVEHKLSADAEFCPSGLLFKKATDGRAPKLSAHPVE